jgi:hypothetical protein
MINVKEEEEASKINNIKHKKKISIASASSNKGGNSNFTITYSSDNRKESTISVQSIDPLQKKQGFYFIILYKHIINIIFNSICVISSFSNTN